MNTYSYISRPYGTIYSETRTHELGKLTGTHIPGAAYSAAGIALEQHVIWISSRKAEKWLMQYKEVFWVSCVFSIVF